MLVTKKFRDHSILWKMHLFFLSTFYKQTLSIRNDVTDSPLFTVKELKEVTLSTAGLDGSPNEVLKLVFTYKPDYLLSALSACLPVDVVLV